MPLNPPWYFCCGWWSPWCFLDEWAHRFGLPLDADLADEGDAPDHPGYWLCRKHDNAVVRHHQEASE